MSKPRRLRIGAHIWTVLWSKRAVEKHVKNAVGACSADALEIAVAPQGSKRQMQATLLHEILHACIESSQPGLPYDKEERFVSAVTAPLLDALRSNPRLVEYLLED